jgi:hypothetical protein
LRFLMPPRQILDLDFLLVAGLLLALSHDRSSPSVPAGARGGGPVNAIGPSRPPAWCWPSRGNTRQGLSLSARRFHRLYRPAIANAAPVAMPADQTPKRIVSPRLRLNQENSTNAEPKTRGARPSCPAAQSVQIALFWTSARTYVTLIGTLRSSSPAVSAFA